MDKQTDLPILRKTYGWTERQTDGQIERQKELFSILRNTSFDSIRHTDKLIDRQTCIQIDPSEMPTWTRYDRQTDGQTHRQTSS